MRDYRLMSIRGLAVQIWLIRAALPAFGTGYRVGRPYAGAMGVSTAAIMACAAKRP